MRNWKDAPIHTIGEKATEEAKGQAIESALNCMSWRKTREATPLSKFSSPTAKACATPFPATSPACSKRPAEQHHNTFVQKPMSSARAAVRESTTVRYLYCIVRHLLVVSYKYSSYGKLATTPSPEASCNACVLDVHVQFYTFAQTDAAFLCRASAPA
jgi:hypothetical protein